MAIFVTSDLHLGHDRSFIYEPRGFDCVEDHDLAIVKKWNSIVNWNDTVYVLGDLMLGDNDNGIKLWKQLNGEKKIIIGNHDSDQRIILYELCYNTEVIGFGTRLKYNGYTFLLTHYPTLTSNYDYNKPLKAKVINLCGHCHTSDRWSDWDKGLIYHVELEAHNNKPILIDDILKDIKEKITNDRISTF